MSYARFAEDSDVYVYLDIGGYFTCCVCALDGEETFESTDAMLAHLEEHKAAGHDVPDRCFERLVAEREENDSWISTGEHASS